MPGRLPRGARVVAESDRRQPLGLDLPLLDERRYGDTLIQNSWPPTNRIALCPGTFDPVTFGHMDVINRASGMFDEVVVAVVNLPWRKGATLFSAEERVAFLRNATSALPNISVETFSTLLVDFARERGRRRSSRDCARSPISSTSWR